MEPATIITAATAIAVGLILAAAGLGSALAWGIISSKTLEGISRQPEMRPQLLTNTFLFGGLMESFPFIVLALSLWFIIANPFLG
ncbi:F0F1 ATP synthase subunit C [Thiohalorhabdus methylotrophus]|uniref:ATP synthase subunit c n=1 Tax=Thiohalorhabdus methylotrophus TaxID=3242694 RepID=A0ABV4TRS6_9GAMM